MMCVKGEKVEHIKKRRFKAGEGDVMGREVGGGFIFGNACKN